jgi:hypothetical protein
MNEPLAVEARFMEDGSIRPTAFIWRDKRHVVRAWGRSWLEEDERRFLVMIAGERVYELAFLPAEAAWRMKRTPREFGGQAIV